MSIAWAFLFGAYLNSSLSSNRALHKSIAHKMQSWAYVRLRKVAESVRVCSCRRTRDESNTNTHHLASDRWLHWYASCVMLKWLQCKVSESVFHGVLVS